MVLEDDFLFTDETRIERLVEVLEYDSEVGAVGGALRSRNGRVSAYALDIEIFRDTFFVRECSHRLRLTPRGVAYHICDVTWNFALFRAEMLHAHRWNDQLKMGEHAPYFHQVKLAAKWRVASCPSVVLYHVPDLRTREYQRYRLRARRYFRAYLQHYGLSRYYRIPPTEYLDEMHSRPNVVVMGVGHSGTSVLAKMLQSAGWQGGDADLPYGESLRIRELNQTVLRHGRLPLGKARSALRSLPQPWAIKDPRFVSTLQHWLPMFDELDKPPVLVRIVRNPEQVVASYARRNARGDLRQLVDQRMSMCQHQYDAWPWPKMTIEYERLAEAVALFDPTRVTSPPAAAESAQTIVPKDTLQAVEMALQAAKPANTPAGLSAQVADGSQGNAARAAAAAALLAGDAGSPDNFASVISLPAGLAAEGGSPDDFALSAAFPSINPLEAGSPEDFALAPLPSGTFALEAGSPDNFSLADRIANQDDSIQLDGLPASGLMADAAQDDSDESIRL